MFSYFQLVVMAHDGRGRNATAAITINVARDEQPPEFTNIPAEGASVSENIAEGSGVYTVQAEDPDRRVSGYWDHRDNGLKSKG